MKKIDIFIPYWGDVKLLKEAVDSVLSQSSDGWHLTILDDHFISDEAADYFKTIGNDSRITYIRHPENLGITKNFNYAINSASAMWTVIMGCDDRMLPNYVEKVLSNMGEADIYQPSIDVIDYKGQTYLPLVDRVKRILTPQKDRVYSGEKLAASLCHGNWLYFPSICWRTETLKKHPFNEKYKIVEDVATELSMILEGATLKLDSEVTFQYRRFSESLSSKEKSKNGVRFKEENDVYMEFSKKFLEAGWKSASRAAKLRLTSRIHSILS